MFHFDLLLAWTEMIRRNANARAKGPFMVKLNTLAVDAQFVTTAMLLHTTDIVITQATTFTSTHAMIKQTKFIQLVQLVMLRCTGSLNTGAKNFVQVTKQGMNTTSLMIKEEKY